MSNATHGGKGDRQRKVNAEKYSSNFDAIFKYNREELKEDEDKGNKLSERHWPWVSEMDEK
tara:strand:+ start:465 stop:647 length:183 start_codon:yes stop_codon:yes gene_type:complete